jgi:hypothetical protein
VLLKTRVGQDDEEILWLQPNEKQFLMNLYSSEKERMNDF